MTTQPSDWAVARAWREVTAGKPFAYSHNLIKAVNDRARELYASGDAPRAAEAGDAVKAVLDWQPLTHLNKGDRLYQILEAAGLPFDDQADSLRAAMGAVGAGGGE